MQLSRDIDKQCGGQRTAETRTTKLWGKIVNLLMLRRAIVLIGICGTTIHAGTALCQQAATDPPDVSTGPALQEVMVTATRQAQPLSKVPISVSAFTAAKMQELHIKGIEDVQAYTPGLNVQASGYAGTNISIRGISSTVGSATTGVYIDDTPIQVRQVGYTSFNIYPNVFDLERIEVLRGPQGTLFGAGSEGGTVRFITPPPNLSQASGHAEAETDFSEFASPSYEAGVAYGAPIIKDKLGFRASAWYRTTGGYIDWVDRSTGASRGHNVNYGDDKAAQLAVGLKPSESLTITPSIFYQEHDSHHSPATFWESLSDPDAGSLVTANNLLQPVHDRFTLPSIKVQYDFARYQLTSVTSYFERQEDMVSEYSYLFPSAYTGDPFVPGFPNYTVAGLFTNNQRNFTEELRLQSRLGTRLDWTAGIFYTHNRQWSTQHMDDPDMSEFTETDFGLTPEQMFGAPLYLGRYSVYFLNNTLETQIAAFAEAHWNVTDKLKLTVGARGSHAGYDFDFIGDGPYNAGFSESSGKARENPVTEKVGLSYQIDPAKMVYVSASKGYRIGGANTLISQTLCAKDLANFGLKQMPATYASDSLWNYELGGKFKFLENRVQVDASVYYIDWKNIQQSVNFPICAFNFIANLNKATSRGFDLSATAQLTNHWVVDFAAGYTDAFYPNNTYGGFTATGARAILFGKGDPLGVPDWNASIGSRYAFQLWGGRSGYLRADYSYTSGYLTGSGPGTAGYEPEVRAVGKVNLLKARLAVNLTDEWELDLFGDNLLDDRPHLARSHLGSARDTTFTNVTIYPRSFGISTTVNF
jgi:iron complex outermembrane recepter protein